MHEEAPIEEYFPMSQLKQLELDKLFWYVPAAHELHELAPSNEYAPASHCPQTVAPIDPAKLPAEHGRQIVAPAEEAKEPREQSVQAEDVEAPVVVRYDPPGHKIH